MTRILQFHFLSGWQPCTDAHRKEASARRQAESFLVRKDSREKGWHRDPKKFCGLISFPLHNQAFGELLKNFLGAKRKTLCRKKSEIKSSQLFCSFWFPQLLHREEWLPPSRLTCLKWSKTPQESFSIGRILKRLPAGPDIKGHDVKIGWTGFFFIFF